MTQRERFLVAAFGSVIPPLALLAMGDWRLIALNPTASAILGRALQLTLLGILGGGIVSICYKKVSDHSAIFQLGLSIPSFLLMLSNSMPRPPVATMLMLPKSAFETETAGQQFARGLWGRLPPNVLEASLPHDKLPSELH